MTLPQTSGIPKKTSAMPSKPLPGDPPLPKSRKAIQQEIRREKAIVKAKKKAGFQKKAKKKLAEKAERKIINKKNNSQRKLAKKIQGKIPAGKIKKKL